jgi:tRNA-2-methylthio-N6-dimethylallyladenosine synthase
MKKRFVHIHTMGCQMNVYDSGQIYNRLIPMGYASTENLEKADLIILNTCSIREKAEQKAFSFLGRLAPLKQNNPELIIGVGGCVAQQEGRRILKRMPFVDLVFGTQAIARLPGLIERITRSRSRMVDIEISATIGTDDFTLGPYSQSDTSAFVTIMRGCDNYCTYCVVPSVRGRESSRSMESILKEIRYQVSKGIREVTLLGQNVNSYGQKEGFGSFARLLTEIDAVAGLERIRFTTSHPKDLSAELIHCFGRLEKLCEHIHLPVQSGSDRILRRMNRRYTRRDYIDKVSRLRHACPDIALTSDIIVGFPGETDEDFAATLTLIEQIGFDGLFAFVYSDRPDVPAARFEAKVDEPVKKERLQKLLGCQEKFTLDKHRSLVGTVQEVLVDGIHKADTGSGHEAMTQTGTGQVQWSGRTRTNKIVHFFEPEESPADNQRLTGQVLRTMIEEALPHCLLGRRIISQTPMAISGKGERTYVA